MSHITVCIIIEIFPRQNFHDVEAIECSHGTCKAAVVVDSLEPRVIHIIAVCAALNFERICELRQFELGGGGESRELKSRSIQR